MINIKYYWQISKYRKEELPLYREGSIPTWTSVSDIGRMINGKVLTVNDYLTVENLYIQAINAFMMCTNTKTLFINQLEKPFDLEVIKERSKQKGLNDNDFSGIYDFYQLIKEGASISRGEVEFLSRLALRENLWAQLQCETMFLRFDYDYYIDIGSFKKCEEAVEKIRNWGLTINQWDEPYPFGLSTN